LIEHKGKRDETMRCINMIPWTAAAFFLLAGAGPPGEFRSAADVHAWAARTFPNLRPGSPDVGALPVSTWNLLAPELDRLAREWPEVAARLEGLQPPGRRWDTPRTAPMIAEADNARGRWLAFRPDFWAGAPDPRARPADVVRHEWAHLLQAWLRDAHPAVHLELVRVFRDRSDRFDRRTASEVSRRAEASEAEAFAEAFVAAASRPEGRPAPARRFAAILARFAAQGQPPQGLASGGSP